MWFPGSSSTVPGKALLAIGLKLRFLHTDFSRGLPEDALQTAGGLTQSQCLKERTRQLPRCLSSCRNHVPSFLQYVAGHTGQPYSVCQGVQSQGYGCRTWGPLWRPATPIPCTDLKRKDSDFQNTCAPRGWCQTGMPMLEITEPAAPGRTHSTDNEAAPHLWQLWGQGHFILSATAFASQNVTGVATATWTVGLPGRAPCTPYSSLPNTLPVGTAPRAALCRAGRVSGLRLDTCLSGGPPSVSSGSAQAWLWMTQRGEPPRRSQGSTGGRGSARQQGLRGRWTPARGLALPCRSVRPTRLQPRSGSPRAVLDPFLPFHQ